MWAGEGIVMSTRESLEKLDLGQLERAKEIIQELLNTKVREKKKLIWRVTDGVAVYGNFAKDQYLQAAELLLKEAQKQVEKGGGDYDELTISKEFVLESEYAEYIDT